jgi:hypothetical protein
MINDVSLRGNRPQELILAFPCPQRILMVTDGSLSFGNGGFGLSEFVSIVQSAGHSVSTAHRSGVAPVSIPGAFNFQTAAKPVVLGNYDQVWLFGFSATPLTIEERAVVSKFMAEGGGVFATGDHQTLGSGMGSVLPRVRAMRNWSSIPMETPQRLDTVLEPGPDGHKQFQDQSDNIPQRIYPVFLSSGGDPFVMATWSPHPLLRHASGVVDCLPDHPHESECLAPLPVAGVVVNGFEEWPAAVNGGVLPRAMIVARSISGGRFVESGAPTATGTKPPVVPRCFGAIAAYDGDAAKVGRVVTDATWHHYVNTNLNGSGSGRTGLYNGGVPTAEYEKIKQYYRNTVRWLAPRNRRACWPWLQLALARFDFEMIEELRPMPHPCPWDPMVRIGALVEDVLVRTHGAGIMEEIVGAFLDTAQTAQVLRTQFELHAPEQLEVQTRRDAPVFLPRDLARRAVIGSVMNLLLQELPEDEATLTRAIENHDALAQRTILEGVRAAEAALLDYLRRGIAGTQALVNTLAPQTTALKS